MPNKTFEIQLEKLTYGGDAMGRLHDGRAVFVPFCLPGERVRVRLVEEKKNFVRAKLLDVLEPATGRITPRCIHFGVCGGCHYQHMPYETQLAAKTKIVRDQLQRIGKIENPPVQPTVGCPNPYYYRNHIQFHLSENGKLGYVRATASLRKALGEGSSEERVESILEISECHLPEPLVNATWPRLEFESDTSIERVALREGVDEDLMLILESEETEAPEMELEAGMSVVHLTEEDALVMAGEDHLVMQVLDRAFRVSAGSFFQVNTVMAEKMVTYLLEKLPLPAKTILDVYCGVGLFSAFLAPHCERLIGVEESASATEDFAVNLDEFDHVELYEGAAEEVLPALVGRIDRAASPIGDNPAYVLMDPPRAGVDKDALDAIRQLAPEVIAYVSCDPSTLARDAARLIAGGYRLVEVTPFDLFPQTYHIESISLFKR